MAQKGRIAIIRDYFGVRPGETSMNFMEEYKALNEADKNELAKDSANALGLRQEAVSFPLA